MPKRIYNFSPGPAVLPEEVLEQAAKDIINYNDKGIGLIELSHRGKEFMAIAQEAADLIREGLDVPENYKILFLQGGASTQFAMVPMNLLGPGKSADYLNTGTWAKKAIKEANIVASCRVVYSSEDSNFDHVPHDDDYLVDPAAEYLYYVSNNTIFGTQFHHTPETDKMLVCDMSSDIFSRSVDVSKYGLIFGGAQKNMGPAGATVVIIRDDLLDRVPETVPTMFRYKTHVDKDSMFNTPPCFGIYIIGQVCKWVKKLGGISAMEQINREKAQALYDMLDSTDFYRCHARKDSRSHMNVTFNLPTPELETKLVQEGTERGFEGLKGHRSVGGLRASIYNAFPRKGVYDLIELLKEFERKNS